MGLWEKIRHALGAMWEDWRAPHIDEHSRLVSWLSQSWQAEHGLSMQIQLIVPLIPYEQFRRRLEIMVRDDAHHAELLGECLGSPASTPRDVLQARVGWPNRLPPGPWHRLRQVLSVKRELYEGYRQEATIVDDPSLHALLERLRDDEAQHQEQLIDMLMQLDAHVHETIT